METNVLVNENNNEVKSSRIRMIIFAVATIAIFMFWGMRVYADNAVNVKQGETKVVRLDVAAELSSPSSEEIKAQAFIGGVESTEVRVTVTDKEAGLEGTYNVRYARAKE